MAAPTRSLSDMILAHLVNLARRVAPDDNPYPAAATADALAKRFKTTPARLRTGPLRTLRAKSFVSLQDDVYWLTYQGAASLIPPDLSFVDRSRQQRELAIDLDAIRGRWHCANCQARVTRETGFLTADAERIARHWRVSPLPRILVICCQCKFMPVRSGTRSLIPKKDETRLERVCQAREAAWPPLRTALEAAGGLTDRQLDALGVACIDHGLEVNPATVKTLLKKVWGNVMDWANEQYPYRADEHDDREEWWEEYAKDEAGRYLAAELGPDHD